MTQSPNPTDTDDSFAFWSEIIERFDRISPGLAPRHRFEIIGVFRTLIAALENPKAQTLTAEQEPNDLTQEEAARLSGEVSKDRFARNPAWRRALTRTYGRPRYSRRKILAIKAALARQAEIASSD